MTNLPGSWPGSKTIGPLRPWRENESFRFLWSRIIKHHEYITVGGIFLMLMMIRLYDELFLAKEPAAHQMPLIIATGVLVLALALERIFVSRLHITFFERLREKDAPKNRS